MESTPPLSQVIRKVTLRLLPFMFLLYIVNYVDRINVGIAQLQMHTALNLSDSAFAQGAGVFFVGYFLFEIPSNLILQRVGARRWIARIMVTWGIVSCSMMFARGPASFFVLRFLLGLAEAGFFPGMILYLTYWFPSRERARAISRFMIATPLAGVVAGPASAWLLTHTLSSGLAGWQSLFVVEGLPAVVLGVAVFFYLPDRPREAVWLTEDDKRVLQTALDAERRPAAAHTPLVETIAQPAVLALTLIYFTMQIGFYGYNMWLPQIIKSLGKLDTMTVGLLSAVPYLVAAAAMVLVGSNSDRTGERRLHITFCAGLASVGLALSAMLLNHPAAAITALTITAVGLWGTLGPFWAVPTALLEGTSAAAGIALINSVGNLGGYFGPVIMGEAKTLTHSYSGGLWLLAVSLLIAAVVTALTVPATVTASEIKAEEPRQTGNDPGPPYKPSENATEP